MNHAFVIVKGSLSELRLDTLLREIVRERWGDLVTVDHDEHWEIKWGTDYSFGLSVWIHSARKIEMRKQLGQLSSWLQTFIQESLAARLVGKCGDEGTRKDRWVGKPENFQTFQQWWDHMHEGWGDVTPEEQMVTDDCFQRVTGKAPKELLDRRAPV